MSPELLDHKPEGALHAGTRGTELIEELLVSASGGLRPGGLLLAEHQWDQGRRLRDVARVAFSGIRIETKRGLAGLERVLVVEITQRMAAFS